MFSVSVAIEHLPSVLPIMTAIGAATLVGVVGTGWLFMAINVSDSEAVEVAGVFFGFWMIGGFSLAGVVRKLQRIMRDANAE